MRVSSSTSLIMKVILASAWLAVLLAFASLAASDDTGPVSIAAAQPAVRPSRTDEGYFSRSWPEVVGMSSEEAKKKICEHWPCAHVHVVPAGAYVTMDYNTWRIRVLVDSYDKVAEVRIG